MALRGWLCSLYPFTFSELHGLITHHLLCAQPPVDYVETTLPPSSCPQSSMLPNMISCGWSEQERTV